MKKIISVISASVLMVSALSGCTLLKKESETYIPEDTYFMLNKLPDIGAYSLGDKISYFYRTGALNLFEPSDGYGGVVPYCSSSAEYKGPEGENAGRLNFYGLASAQGKIITTGIYSNISSITSSDGRTFFVCTKISGDSDNKYYDIISEDGSKLIVSQAPAEDNEAVKYFSGMPCECFTVTDKDAVKLYDFSGRLIADMTKAFGADCYFEILYCDGEKIIFSPLSNRKTPIEEREFLCINKDGKLLYRLDFEDYYPLSYQGGCLIIRNSKGQMKLSDVLGNILTEKKAYSDIIFDKTEKTFWCLNEKNKTIEKLSSSAKLLLKKSISDFENPEMTFLSSPVASTIMISGDGGNKMCISVKTGKKVKLKTGSSTSVMSDGKYDYTAVYNKDYIDFYDASGTYITAVKGIKDLYGLSGGKLAYRDRENRLCIKGLKSSMGDFKIKLKENQTENLWVENFDENTITLCVNGKTTVYSLKTQSVIAKNMNDIISMSVGGSIYITGRKGDKYLLINQKGERLISISDKSFV